MNNNYISLIAMLVSLFFAGAYLRGESVRKKEMKAEIKSIRESQKQIEQSVTAIMAVTPFPLFTDSQRVQSSIHSLLFRLGMDCFGAHGFGCHFEYNI